MTDLLPTGDGRRDDLELEEVWRAAAAGGYDTDVEVTDGLVSCPVCGVAYRPDVVDGDRYPARDTASGRSDLVVWTLTCPGCGTPERLAAPAGEVGAAPSGPTPEVTPGEVEAHAGPPAGATPDRPLGEDRRFFQPGAPGTLAEQGSLLDEQGEDIRQYTGEPVETEEGWVIPQQQNVGPGNEAGGGEWPDPASPSAMPKHDDPRNR